MKINKIQTLPNHLPFLIEKLSLLALIILGGLVVRGISTSVLEAAAVVPPTISMLANPTNIADFNESTVEILIKNDSQQNTIDNLKITVSFPQGQNPTKIESQATADSLSKITTNVAISVPSSRYLNYVANSTEYVAGSGSSQISENLSDINGTSPLFFDQGILVNNISDSGSETRIKFKVRVAEDPPQVFNPQLDFYKYVANTSNGESLTDQKTNTTINDNDVVAVQLFLHNKVLQSKSTNVRVQDEEVDVNKSLAAHAYSQEQEALSASVKISSTASGDLKLIPGSVVVKDVSGSVVKTLNDSEVDALFGTGWLLNTDGVLNGCWEFMRLIEYKVTLADSGEAGITDLEIDKKVRFNNRTYDNIDRSVNSFDPGEEIVYEMTVHNDSDEVARDVEIEDTLLHYIDFITCSDHCNYDHSSREVTFKLGDIASGESEEVDLTVKVKDVLPTGDRTQENIATACGDNASCSSDTAVVWINGPDISTEQKVVRGHEKQQMLKTVVQLPVTGNGDFLTNWIARVWLKLVEFCHLPF